MAQTGLGQGGQRAAPAALEAARKADVVIAVVGITSQLEGEEMPVSEPGFLGGDRTSIDLPQPEEELRRGSRDDGQAPRGGAHERQRPGRQLGERARQRHPRIVVSGEEGGAAIAATLSGKNNPAGRLPVTFYTGVDQLPPFRRLHDGGPHVSLLQGKPLYPFGYGLSYTTFTYKALNLPGKRDCGRRATLG